MDRSLALFVSFSLLVLVIWLIINQAPARQSQLSFLEYGNHETALVATSDGTINLAYHDFGRVAWSFSSGSPIHSSYQAPPSDHASASGGSYFLDCGDDWKLFAHTEHGRKVPFFTLPKEKCPKIAVLHSQYPLFSIWVIACLVVAVLAGFFMHRHYSLRPITNAKSSRKKRNKKSKNNNKNEDGNGTGEANGDEESLSFKGKVSVFDKEIGRGSNGTVVFEGQFNGRSVAVKRLLRTHHDVTLNEIHYLRLSDHHPSIVRWYDLESDQNFYYLSMERCDCNLYDLINSEAEWLWKPNDYPSPILLKILRDTVSGLAHLHKMGIIHRDLKPQNVLIVGLEREDILGAKLSDMGISRCLVGDATSLDPSASGSSGWRAPEQLLDGRQTLAVDLFTLGCVIFFCVTRGEHPFGGPLERDANVVRSQWDLSLVRQFPEAWNLISKLLNHDAKLRPEAAEVLHHPMFWNSQKRLLFLRDASDRLEEEREDPSSVILQRLEGGVGQRRRRRRGQGQARANESLLVFAGTWDNLVGVIFVNDINSHRHYRFTHLQDLLRAIRNKLNHYRQSPPEIKELLGCMPDGFDEYFTRRFPKLLMFVHEVMYEHCKEEGWFRRYLEN